MSSLVLKKLNSLTWVRERPLLVDGVSANFCGIEGCHVVRLTDPYGRNLDLLERNGYFFFQVAPQLYSWGWVDSVPDSLVFRKFGSARNRTRTSGSVARNSEHQTTEAVYFLLHNIYKKSSYLTGNRILHNIQIQFVPHRKHNTSPLCSQKLWPLDHRGGLLSST
jgi:hypothetical protein